jgi:tetratricopeptide (TPR) repeat protein
MSPDPSIQQLVDQILESNRAPEEVCIDYPQLLPVVRRRLNVLSAVEARVNLLFPPAGSARSDPDGAARQSAFDLPRIPGYELQAVLGRGGIGVVYKAWDLRLNRPVALKMLLSGEYAQLHQLERFHREVEAIAGIRHPNIVQVFDIGNHNDVPYFTMEYVEDGNLAQRLTGAPLHARQAASLAATLADAIGAVHGKGIIHRDIKPANVLMTADGIPKLTDFGLALQMNAQSGLTEVGMPVGTPSYMSPEQAGGNSAPLHPSTDIYSLGAILYEFLTGRPPFRAVTSVETRRQVIENEPAAPSKLNAKVPGDLETICLKCLSKDPIRLYATAGDLSADLRRFLAAQPIHARPVGSVERMFLWARRQPAKAAAAASAVLLALLIGAAGFLLASQRAQNVREVTDELNEVKQLQLQSDWSGGDAKLERVKVQLGAGGPDVLRQRLLLLEQLSQGHQLIDRLDAICLDRASEVDGLVSNAQADQGYETEFRVSGLGSVGDAPKIVAARIAASPFRAELVAALDDWSGCAKNQTRRAWLMDVARRADPDPWRDVARDPAKWSNKAAVTVLVQSVPQSENSVHLLLALAVSLEGQGGDARPLLTSIQRQHPDDFWANFWLGRALRKSDPEEAVGYFRAALALRPGTAIVYANLGSALQYADHTDDAVEAFEQAVKINPDYPWAYGFLGKVFWYRGNHTQAILEYEHIIHLQPTNATARYNLAKALWMEGRFDEAAEQFWQSLQLDPNKALTHFGLGQLFQAEGKIDQAVAEFKRAIELQPDFIRAHFALAEVYRDQHKFAEATAEYQLVLAQSSWHGRANYGLGEILRAKGDFPGAIEQYRRAVELDPTFEEASESLAAALKSPGANR